MRRLIPVLFLAIISNSAFAQNAQDLGLAKAVTACGGQTLVNGLTYPVTQDLTGLLCTGAQISGGTSTNLTEINGVAITGGAPGQLPVNPQPTTTGGLSVYTVQPAASDNHATIKASAGQVYKISITGNATQTTVQYVRLYNAAGGFNGCNSATNLIYSNAIPFSTEGSGILDLWSNGMAFSTGISICITGGYGNTDTTNATASAMNVNIGYK